MDEQLSAAADALNSRHYGQTGIEVLVRRCWHGLNVVQGLWAVDSCTDVFEPVRQRWIWSPVWRPKQPPDVAADNMESFFSTRPDLPPDERPIDGPQRVPTRFVGVALDEVRSGGTGLYEVYTTTGVPVRLHDMSLSRLTHDAAARTLIVEFVYDDPQWTPPTAEATPVAVFSFDDVEVLEQEDESAEPGTPPTALGQVQGFDYWESNGIFALQVYTTYWVFRASVVTLRLISASSK